MTYTVMSDFLDHIVKESGEFPDGRPKEVKELHEGDTSDFTDVDADRIQVWKDAGAIEDTSVAQDRQSKREQAASLMAEAQAKAAEAGAAADEAEKAAEAPAEEKPKKAQEPTE